LKNNIVDVSEDVFDIVISKINVTSEGVSHWTNWFGELWICLKDRSLRDLWSQYC